MVKILSFDIGIRNLAYAYIDINSVDDFKIVDWEVIDILDNTISTTSQQFKINCNICGCVKPPSFITETGEYYCQIHSKKVEDEKDEIFCSQLMTNGNPCKGKPVKMDEEGNYYCTKHCGDDYINISCNHPNCGKAVSFMRENSYYCKVHSKTFFDKKEIKCMKKGKNGKICGGLVKCMNDKDQYFCEKHRGNLKHANTYDLYYLGSNLYKKLDTIHQWKDCELVLLENQPFMKNQRMKTIQMIVYSYFLLRNNRGEMNIKKIINFSARHKLDFDGAKEIEVNDKSAYKTRKKQGIEAVKKILKDKPLNLSFLEGHKKKDDLCDSLMQALSFFDSKYG